MNKPSIVIIGLSSLYSFIITLLLLFSSNNQNEEIKEPLIGYNFPSSVPCVPIETPVPTPTPTPAPRKLMMAELDLQAAAIRNSHVLSQSYQTFFWYILSLFSL